MSTIKFTSEEINRLIDSIDSLCNTITTLCGVTKKTATFNGRVFNHPSELIPNQTYTIRELYDRAIVNSLPEINVKKFYAEDTNDVDILFNRSGIDLQTLDLVELAEYNEKVNRRINELRAKKTEVKAEPAPNVPDNSNT